MGVVRSGCLLINVNVTIMIRYLYCFCVLTSALCYTQRRSFDFPFSGETDSMTAKYSNTWALKISGGPDAAHGIASKHGLINRGQIGLLKDMYLFELSGGTEEEMPSKTEVLKAEPNVLYVEQQKYSHHALKQK